MISIPSALQAQLLAWLKNQAIPDNTYASCMKWLRYYWDFCEKYRFPHTQRDSLAHFLNKLAEKKQTQTHQQQEFQAVTLYYELVHQGEPRNPVSSPQAAIAPGKL